MSDAVYPQYSGLKLYTISITINKEDRYVKMKDNSIVKIKTIATSKICGNIIIIGRPFENVTDWFTTPNHHMLVYIIHFKLTHSLIPCKKAAGTNKYNY